MKIVFWGKRYFFKFREKKRKNVKHKAQVNFTEVPFQIIVFKTFQDRYFANLI